MRWCASRSRALGRLGAGALLLVAVVLAQPQWASAESAGGELPPSGPGVQALSDEQLDDVRGRSQPPSADAERRKSVVLWDEARSADPSSAVRGLGNRVSVSGGGLGPSQIQR